MRFSCERCGKRYATAEAPTPGRVYKIRCRACGHLIVVKGAAAARADGSAGPVAVAEGSMARVRAAPAAAVPAAPAGAAAVRAAERIEPVPPPSADEPGFFDPFEDLAADEGAPLRDELLLTPAPVPLPVAAGRTPPPAPLATPGARAHGRGPILLIALGGLVLVGILAFVLLGGRAPDAAATARLAPPPPATASVAPGAVPAPASAPVGAGEPHAAAEGHGRERVAQRGADGARGRAPETSGRLTAAQIHRVLARSRRPFQDCLAAAARSGDVKLDGRRVMLRLDVQTNGAVGSPSIDDAALDASDLGACLKSCARTMEFPRFSGEPVRVEIPLVLPRQ